jgi:hypothetical protein
MACWPAGAAEQNSDHEFVPSRSDPFDGFVKKLDTAVVSYEHKATVARPGADARI